MPQVQLSACSSMHGWSTAGASMPSRRKVALPSCSVPPSFTIAVAARISPVVARIRSAEARRDAKIRMAHHFDCEKLSSTAARLFLRQPLDQQEGDAGNGNAQRQQDETEPERERQVALAGF